MLSLVLKEMKGAVQRMSRPYKQRDRIALE